MKVTYNWLKDFVEIKIKPEALADTLTLAGLEVTSLEKFENDYVFEIEVTSNRPDWLSVIGIAREVAAVTGKKIKTVTGYRLRRAKDKGRLVISIEDKTTCPFYSARIIHNVKVGPSPEWMAKRLQAIGLRPINNIVDITNYVLFTTGQPLHAFDLDKIYVSQSPIAKLAKSPALPSASPRGEPKDRQIIVRRARDGEEIITIDGIKRKLTPEILIIADEKNPIAIAGIMGGKESEVNESTRHILLESAYFSPVVTRRASRILGLSSDSSYRFERSVDKSRIVQSSDFASSLILRYLPVRQAGVGGEIGALYKLGSDKVKKKIISFDVKKSNTLIGVEMPFLRIKSILKSLAFKILSEKKDILNIEAPDFRQDILSQEDVAEELCRIYGYEDVPLHLPAIRPNEIKEDSMLRIEEKIRELLIGAGFTEALTYSLQSSESIKKAGFRLDGLVHLENPLSIEQETLRPSLLIGLLQTLGRNLELGNSPCMLFEIGECFTKASEYRSLAVITEKRRLLELKGMLELLLKELGITRYIFSQSANALFQEGQSGRLIAGGEEVGALGQIRKEILQDFKIDAPEAAALEIHLDRLKKYVNFQKAYQPLHRYPSVRRDISVIVDEAISYQKLLDAIKTSPAPYLAETRCKDMYRSETIGQGKKSITLSLEFRSPEKTLTDAEVNASLENIIQQITKALGAAIR